MLSFMLQKNRRYAQHSVIHLRIRNTFQPKKKKRRHMQSAKNAETLKSNASARFHKYVRSILRKHQAVKPMMGFFFVIRLLAVETGMSPA